MFWTMSVFISCFFCVLCWFFLKHIYIYIYDNCSNSNNRNLNPVIDMMLFGVSHTVVKHPCWTCRVKQHDSNIINTNDTLWSSCLLFVFTHFIISALWGEPPPATPPSFLFGPWRRAASVKRFRCDGSDGWQQVDQQCVHLKAFISCRCCFSVIGFMHNPQKDTCGLCTRQKRQLL